MQQQATAAVIPMPSGIHPGKFGIRPIATFPEFVGAVERLVALTAVRDAAADKLLEFPTLLREEQALINEFRGSIEFRIYGARPPEPTLDDGDLARLQYNYDAAQEDLIQHHAAFDEIKGRCASEIMSAARPAHQRLMMRMLHAVTELSNALDEESEFRDALAIERVSAGFPTIPFAIRSAIGSKQNEWSGVSQTMKMLEPYVMQPAGAGVKNA